MVTLFTAKPQGRPIHRHPEPAGRPRRSARAALLAAISKLH
jgi:hypothetical protein